MDKKGWTRILIVIVAGLWAYNIYRTVENYQVQNESQESQRNLPPNFAPIMFNKDTFNLYLPNQDPFLKNQKWNRGTGQASVTYNSQNDNRTPRPLPTLPKPDPVVKWPSVKFYGYVMNHEDNRKLCMINISGRNYRLHAGESKENVEVINVYPDSVVVKFNEQLKTFLK